MAPLRCAFQPLFLSDGTPVMTATAFDEGKAAGGGRTAFPALAGADSGGTAQGKSAR